jgi:hypothetical protein
MTAATPSEIGAIAEREVAYALGCLGYDIYVPMFMPHSRIDFIAARGAEAIRIQVKSARTVGEVVRFHACSNTGNIPKEYSGEVDAFGIYSPDTGQCYLVPIDDVPTRAGSLRIAPPRNNQQKGIRWADDYLIGRPGP